MLITLDELVKLLNSRKIKVSGCLHIGAHLCEEMYIYNSIGITNKDIIWIEANNELVKAAKNKNIINVYNAVITDIDDELIIFNKADDTPSSSILSMLEHKNVYPNISYIEECKNKSITIDTFIAFYNLNEKMYDFMNIAIQGAELLALKGAIKFIKNVKIIYCKIHEIELYKNCASITELDDFLFTNGFIRVFTITTEKGWGDAIYIRV
jgi:FkbM family methyltransferase